MPKCCPGCDPQVSSSRYVYYTGWYSPLNLTCCHPRHDGGNVWASPYSFRFMKMKLPALLLAACAAFLAGCAGNQAQIMQQADFNGVPKPGQVFVGQFAFAVNDANPDQSILNRMQNQYTQTQPQTPEDQAGLAVAQTMQKSLIKNLNKEGVVAIGTLNNVVPQVGSMLIEGELLTVKQGGGFQRLSPGLGSGQAKVVSYVNVYLVTDKGVSSFAKFYSDTKSSVQPEVETSLTVGSAAGNSGWSAAGTVDTLTARTQSAKSDAVLIAKQIARKIQSLFIAETWLSPSSPN